MCDRRKNDQRTASISAGVPPIADFSRRGQVFGKGNVAGRERASNELERIRREEGGVIDRYEWRGPFVDFRTPPRGRGARRDHAEEATSSWGL